MPWGTRGGARVPAASPSRSLRERYHLRSGDFLLPVVGAPSPQGGGGRTDLFGKDFDHRVVAGGELVRRAAAECAVAQGRGVLREKRCRGCGAIDQQVLKHAFGFVEVAVFECGQGASVPFEIVLQPLSVG